MKNSLILISTLFAASGFAWASVEEARDVAVTERERENAREAWEESSEADAGTETETKTQTKTKTQNENLDENEAESWWEWFLRERHLTPNVGRRTEVFAGTAVGGRTRIVLPDVAGTSSAKSKSGEETIEKREEKLVDEEISNGDKNVVDPKVAGTENSATGDGSQETNSAGTGTKVLRTFFSTKSASAGTVTALCAGTESESATGDETSPIQSENAENSGEVEEILETLTLSGTVFSLDAITLTSATAIADNSLEFTTDRTETLAASSFTDKKLEYSSVTVADDITGIIKISENNYNLKLDLVKLGTAASSLEVQDNVCDFLTVENLEGAGIIKRSRASTNNGWGSGTVIGATDSDLTNYSFTGTVQMVNSESHYSQVLYVENESILKRASVNLGNYSTLSLDLTNTKIGGLVSDSSATLGIVVSCEKPSTYSFDSTSNQAYNYHAGSVSGDPNNTYLRIYNANDTTARTLELTGTGEYSYYGIIGDSTNPSSVNINKTGSGTQTLAGTNYLGDVTVSDGTLNLTGTTNIVGTMTLSGGETNISGTATLAGTTNVSSTLNISKTTTNSGTINLLSGSAMTIASSSGTGVVDFDGSAGTLNIAEGTTLTVTASSNGVVKLGALGSGAIEVKNSAISHGFTVDVGEDFAGTFSWAGNFNPANLKNLDSGIDLVLSQNANSAGSMWSSPTDDGAQTIDNHVVINGTYGVQGTVGYTFTNGIEGANGDGTDILQFTTAGASITVSGGTLEDITISKGSVANTAVNITGTVAAAGTVEFAAPTNVSGTLNVNAGATAKFAGTTTNSGTINLLAGATATITSSSAAGVVDFDGSTGTLNIAKGATLAVNSTSGAATVKLGATGTGEIAVTNSSDKHGFKVDVGEDFAGTFSWAGNLNPSNLTNLKSSVDLVLKQNSSSVGSMWGGDTSAEIANHVVIDGTYQILRGAGNTITFQNGIEGQNDGVLSFAADSNKNNTGSAVVIDGGTLKNITIQQNSVGSMTLELAGTVTADGNVEISGEYSLADNADFKVLAGSETTFAGTVTGGATSVVSVNTTGTLNLTGMSTLGSLNVDGKLVSKGTTNLLTMMTNYGEIEINSGTLTVTHSAASGETAVAINSIAGTISIAEDATLALDLDLEDSSSTLNSVLNATGTGTIVMTNESDYYALKLVVGDDFAGTLEWAGNLDPSLLQSYAGAQSLTLSQNTEGTGVLWSENASNLTTKVIIDGNYEVAGTAGVTFSSGLEGANDATLTLSADNAQMTISGCEVKDIAITNVIDENTTSAGTTVYLSGNVTSAGTVSITGTTRLLDDAEVNVAGELTLVGTVTSSANSSVDVAATGTLNLDENSTVSLYSLSSSGTLNAAGTTTLSGITLIKDGTANFTGTQTIAALTLWDGETNISGTTTFTGETNVDADATLNLSGTVTDFVLESGIANAAGTSFAGDTKISGTLNLSGTNSSSGKIYLYDATMNVTCDTSATLTIDNANGGIVSTGTSEIAFVKNGATSNGIAMTAGTLEVKSGTLTLSAPVKAGGYTETALSVTGTAKTVIANDATLAIDVDLTNSGGNSNVYFVLNATSDTTNGTGKGKITVKNTGAAHNVHLDVGNNFAGTLEWTGNLNPGNLKNYSGIQSLTLASNGTAYSSSGYLWSLTSQTIAAATIIDGNYGVGGNVANSIGVTYTFSKGLSGTNNGTLIFVQDHTSIAVVSEENSNVEIGNIMISNGSRTDVALNFAGTVNSAGTVSADTAVNLAENATFAVSANSTVTFSGTISGETNSEINVNSTGTLNLSGTEVAGTQISVSSGATANLTGTTSLSDSTLSVAGTANLAGTLNLTGGTLTAGGNVTLDSGILVTADADSTISVASGGMLAVAGTLNLSSAIENAGTVAVDSAVVFNLDAWEHATNDLGERTYVIIDGGTLTGTTWKTLTAENFIYENATISSRKVIDLSTAGAITISGTVADLIWAGTKNSNTWNNDTSNLVWVDENTTNADYFLTSDNVTFDDTAANQTVELGDNVSAKSMLVKSGTYTINSNGYSINLETAMTIHEGATLILTSAGTLVASDTIENNGTLQLNGFFPTNVITGAGTLILTEPTETTTFSEANFITDRQTLVIEAGSQKYVIAAEQSYSGGTILRSGTLGVVDTSAFGSGAITIENGTLLAETGGNMVLPNDIDVTGTGTLDTQSYGGAISGKITVESGATLNLKGTGGLSLSGTITAAGTVNLLEGDMTVAITLAKSSYIANFNVADGLTATFKDTNPSPTTVFGNVSLGDGASLIQYANKQQQSGNFKDYGEMTIGQLTLAGTSATLSAGTADHAGLWKIEGLVGTDAVLNLTTGTTATGSMYSAEFGFSGTQDKSLFSGDIHLTQTSATAGRYAAILISNDHILQNAVLHFDENASTSGGAYILAIDTDNAIVAGWDDTKAGENTTTYVYAGRLHSSTSYTKVEDLFKQYSIYKTLEISVAENESYTFSGTFIGNLDVVKSGLGTQTLSGAISNNKILVNAGTLILSGTDTVAQEIIVSAGTLDVAGSLNIYDLTVKSGSTMLIDKDATMTLSGIVDIAKDTTTNSGTVVAVKDSVIFALDNVAKVETTDTDGVVTKTTYTVIDGTVTNWTSLSASNFSIDSATLTTTYQTVDVTTEGVVVVSGILGLIYEGTKEHHEWNISDTNKIWKQTTTETAVDFTNGVNVFFMDNKAYEPVDVTSSVKMSSLVVMGGDYELDIADSATMTVADVTIANNARLVLKGKGVNVSGRVVVDGVLEMYGIPENQISGHGILVIKDLYNTGLTFDRENTLDGSIQLSKVGDDDTTGTVTIAAAQNYSGGTEIHEGTLAVAVDGALGHGTVTIGVGTLQVAAITTKTTDENGDDATTISYPSLTIENNIKVTGTGSFTDEFGDVHPFVGTPKIDTQAGTLTLTGALSVNEGATLSKIGSGTLNINGNTDIAGTLSVDEGALHVELDTHEHFNVKNLTIADGLLTFIQYKTAMPELELGTVTLGEGAMLQQYCQMSMPIQAVEIDQLKLTGTTGKLSIGDTTHILGTGTKDDNSFGAQWKINELVGGSASAPATLVLEADHNANNFSTFEFSGTQTAGEFTGTISVQEVNTGTNRNAGVIISNKNILENAIISFDTHSSSSAEFALAVNCDYAKIAGLSSAFARTDVFAGTIAAGGNDDATSLYLKSTDFATLEICTAEGTSYVYSGKFLENINLVKSGAGTQVLSGNSPDFVGELEIQEGKLVVNATDAIGDRANINISHKDAQFVLGGVNIDIQSIKGIGNVSAATMDADGNLSASTATLTTEISNFTGTLNSGVTMVVETAMYGTLDIIAGAELDVLRGQEGKVNDNAGTVVVGSTDASAALSSSDVALTLIGVNSGTITVGRTATLVAETAAVGEVNLGISGTLALSETVLAVSDDTANNVTFSNLATIFVSKDFVDTTLAEGESAQVITADDGTEYEVINVIATNATNSASIDYSSEDWTSHYSCSAIYTQQGDAYFKLSDDGSMVQLVYALPEPSMFSLFAGAFALALAGTRRRRSRKGCSR